VIATEDQIREEILDAISQHRIMLFMKGSPEMPRCGFSAQVVTLLKENGAEFVDLGDQFVALMRAPHGEPDTVRHVGIVVDDKDAVRAAALAAGVEVSRPPSLDLHDPWGNLLQIVDYREIQFTKAPEVLAGMGFAGLEKTEAALAELRAKGLA